MRKHLGRMVLGLGLLGAGIGHAAPRELKEVPKNWRLQNYIGDGVNAWYTLSGPQSACLSGNLHFAAATNDDRDRFWKTVTWAKLAGRKMIVFYESTTCAISSFALSEEPLLLVADELGSNR